jgi:carbon monoxide dehydrogenase subunit G
MTKYESSIRVVPYPQERIFNVLSNFDHFAEVIPQDKISNWESHGDHCRFTIENIGEVGLRIVDREAPKTIKYTAEGKTPFNFFLWVQLKEVADNDSRLKLTIKADLNPMMKMIANGPIKKFLELLADGIAKHSY